MLKSYTGHNFDEILGVYYAKARLYSSKNKRFLAQDLVKGNIFNGQTLTMYLYVINSPVVYIDPMGLDKALDDYISKNHSGQSTVTFVVSQPVPGNRQAIDSNFEDIGHAFIRLGYGDGRVIYKGLYPKDPLTQEQIIKKEDVPGKLFDDSKHEWNIAKIYNISQEQAKSIDAYINNYDDDYNMVKNNCTTFAVDTLNSAKIKSPTNSKKWTLPEGLHDLLVDNLPDEKILKGATAS